MTAPDTARREALIAILDTFAARTLDVVSLMIRGDITKDARNEANERALSEAADAILAKEQQALEEALARVEELQAGIDSIHHGYRVNHSSKWVHGVTSALLTTGARP